MTDKLRVHKWWPCGPIFLYVSPGPSLSQGAIAEISGIRIFCVQGGYGCVVMLHHLLQSCILKSL